MVAVRLTSGLQAGEVIEVEPDVAHAHITSGYAVLAAPEKPDTPERAQPRAETRAPARRSRTTKAKD